MKKIIEVVPYDTNWPHIFEAEADRIREALGDNYLAIHHIGSTSVPGLAAKPKIDMIAVVAVGDQAIHPLEKAGFVYKGEWNIPFKFGFTKRDKYEINLHLFEENHPEIELNILFRDHLRSNPRNLEQYAQIKQSLLCDEASFQKQAGCLFSGYNLGKDNFIRTILMEEGYRKHRFVRVTHHKEWEEYHRIRKEQIFAPLNVGYDSNHSTIHTNGHYHFALCQGMEVATVAHVEFLNETNAVLRAIATDEKFQPQDWEKEMIQLLEKWLEKQKVKRLKMHVSLSAQDFYRKLGYVEMLLDGPCIEEQYIDLVKVL